MSSLSLLFGLRSRVTRAQYVGWGFSLAALKVALDTAIVYAFTSHVWSPIAYFVPSMVLRSKNLGSVPQAMHVALALTSLPFIWVGLSMSVRRAADAGLSPWLGAGFLLPVFNYLAMAWLSLKPTSTHGHWEPPALGQRGDEALSQSGRSFLLAVLGSVAIGLAMLGVSVYGLKHYGTTLFFATPFVMGAVAAALYNRVKPHAYWPTMGAAMSGIALTGLAALLFAIEGVLCLAMALPIAMFIAGVGATIAWFITSESRRPLGAPGTMVLMLPLFATAEAFVVTPDVREVTTVIEVDAPPEQVWPNVVGFSELPAPPEWFFKLGISYPLRARIDGEGVGAVRRCEFSTGPFVEPITVWEPPRRLAFDVTSQPPSMTEWSPYRNLKAPHLEHYMVSRGGEFRLVPLDGGRRTRLEGTTHYTMAIYPELYWVAYGEAVLHAIHSRVLKHIKGLSER
ncbi:MAG: SRPBCC family protein [Myxococcaceae bacterium]|nr:SRPBCC family protein [Myxococcaceae bacterium]